MQMVSKQEVECNNCKTKFLKHYSEIKKSKSGIHYCNKNCYYIYQREHPEANPNYGDKIIVQCLNCNKEIKKNRNIIADHGTFCSRVCAAAYIDKTNILLGVDNPDLTIIEGRKIVCEVCGTIVKKINKDPRFCSAKCHSAYKAMDRIGKICTNCGKKIYINKSVEKWAIIRSNNKNFFCSRLCGEKYKVKENSPHWKPDRSKLRKSYLDRFDGNIIKWREDVYRRDNYTCALCNIRGTKLNAHHIKRVVDNPENVFDLDNGITLCVNCHRKVNFKETVFEDEFKFLVTLNSIGAFK